MCTFGFKCSNFIKGLVAFVAVTIQSEPIKASSTVGTAWNKSVCLNFSFSSLAKLTAFELVLFHILIFLKLKKWWKAMA